MAIEKSHKLINSNSNYMRYSKFGEGVTLDPVRAAVDQHACGGGGSMNCGCINGGGSCTQAPCSTRGCGSSNKIKVYR